MNTKRFLIASAVAFAFIFVFEWIVHGIFLEPTYTETARLWRTKEDCIYAAMMAGQILFPLIFGYIFVKGYENKGIAEGVRYGLLIGLLFVPSNLIFYAVMPIPMSLTISWIIGGIIEMIAVGAIFAAVYKPKTA